MTELEHDELKEAMEWIQSFQVSIDPIVERWSAAIIAALEDRVGLQAALAGAVDNGSKLQADRDRLRAALEDIATGNESELRQIARAALEDSDD